jgi:hypothetical protein
MSLDWLTFKSLNSSSFISFVRICHAGVTLKLLVWAHEAFKAGYLLLAVRSAGANLVDKAIVQERGIGVEETWLVQARKVTVGRIARRVAV